MRWPMSSARSYLSRVLPRSWWLLALALGLASPASAQAPGTWAPMADLNQARAEHTATLLANGTVLIAGGRDAADQALASAEIYDPATGGYTLLASPLPAPIWGHTATQLDCGTVSPAAPLNVPRTLASAALLLDGTVLVAGGQTTSEDLDSAEVYDAATNTFAWLPAAMGTARSGHLGVQLLHNGKVLISGGTSGGQLVASAEVYDPVTGAFQPVDSPGTARRLFGANFFELPYTGILLATGGLDSAETPLASSVVFFYPTLRSDKPDYAPGETVTLMGEGWRPNEQVTINIRESSGDPDTNLTATADASGAFTNSEFQTK